MAPAFHLKLENALARADELVAVGQPLTALNLLHEAIMAKWYQHNLLPLEAIMLRFVELCVELRKGRMARDGLHQYRSICQLHNVAGLETVIRHFLERAELRLQEAKARVAQAGAVAEIGDLEATMNAAGGEWEAVMPSLRFVWESYRTVLDICRHNGRLEGLYRVIVEHAFAFCRAYQRRSEFRRLAEMLRHHLAIVIKYPQQANGINLASQESHQLQLELRFSQLQLAMEFGLWQEAFRSIEDVHGLLVMSRRPAQPETVQVYYGHLVRVFAMGGEPLFHAAALARQAAVSTVPADLLILATLAIPHLPELNPLGGGGSGEEEGRARLQRLAAFLGLPKVPSRESLLQEMAESRLAQASSAVQALFPLLAGETLAAEQAPAAQALLAQLSVEVAAPFMAALRANLACAVLRHLTRDPEQRRFPLADLQRLLVGTGEGQFDLRGFLLHGWRVGVFPLRFEEGGQLVVFSRACFHVPTVELDEVACSPWAALQRAVVTTRTLGGEDQAALAQLMAQAVARRAAEHQAYLARNSLMERRREEMEAQRQKREREEARERALRTEREAEAERRRVEEEGQRKANERLAAERERIRREQAEQRDAELARLKELASKRQDLEKLNETVKRLDYLERAMRQEEAPLLAADAERQKEADAMAWQERQRLLVEQHAQKHQQDLEQKAKLHQMAADQALFLATLKASRLQLLEARQAQGREELVKAKAARLAVHQERLRREEERKAAEAVREAERQQEAAQKEAERKEAAEREKSMAAKAGAWRSPTLVAKEASTTTTTTTPPPPAAMGRWRRD